MRFNVEREFKMVEFNDEGCVSTFYATDMVGISNFLTYASSPEVPYVEYTVTKTVALGLVDYIKYRLAHRK